MKRRTTCFFTLSLLLILMGCRPNTVISDNSPSHITEQEKTNEKKYDVTINDRLHDIKLSAITRVQAAVGERPGSLYIMYVKTEEREGKKYYIFEYSGKEKEMYYVDEKMKNIYLLDETKNELNFVMKTKGYLE